MKFFDLPNLFFAIILTYPFVRLRLCDETGSKEFTNQLFWPKINPLWRIIFASKVLPKDRPPFTPVPICSPASTEQSVYDRRGDAGVNLSHRSGIRTHRDHPSPKTKWGLPIPYGITRLPQPDYLEAFPLSDGSVSSPQVEDTPRSLSLFNDRGTQISNPGDLRSGLYGPRPLRPTGNGPGRIQSEKVGQAFLSPSSLFQWNHQRFLAWRTSPWRYSYGYRHSRTLGNLFHQITFLSQEHKYSSRQGFFRSQDYRIFGIPKSSFCDCRQVDQADKKKTLDPAIPQLFKRLTNLGVHLSANGMGKGIPFYSNQTPYPRRPNGTAKPFLHGQVLLAGPRNQYETHSSQWMEILQWSSLRRVDYQRTEGGLSLRENPNERFLSQQILFPHPFVRLQPHKLVQTTMLTCGVSKYDASDFKIAATSNSRGTDKIKE